MNTTVKLTLLPLALVAASGSALATEYGSVISSTPVYGQVAVPQQQCWDEQQVVRQGGTGAGALAGAIIGGVAGNAIGAGMGRAAATGLGVVLGAAVGDQAEANAHPPMANTVRRCQTVSQYENRPVGYDVVYEYNGQRYNTRMAQPPGDRIALNISPAAMPQQQQQMPQSSLPAPVYVPSQQAPGYAVQPVVYAAPAPVYMAPAPVYYYGAPGVVVAPRVVIGGYWRGGRWHY